MYTGSYNNPEYFSIQETSTSVKINNIIESIVKLNTSTKAHQHTGGNDGTVLITTSYGDDTVTLPKVNSLLKTGTGQDYYLIPRGGIIMWSGTLATIPTSWQFCDGTNGTPDLRDRFILSVAAAENPGATGGSHSTTLAANQLPAHSHTTTVGNQSADHTHAISVHNAGAHGHNIYKCSGGDGGGGRALPTGGFSNDSNYWADGGFIHSDGTHAHSAVSGGMSVNHNHTVTVDDSGQSRGVVIDNRPAFYKLAFIMKL